MLPVVVNYAYTIIHISLFFLFFSLEHISIIKLFFVPVINFKFLSFISYLIFYIYNLLKFILRLLFLQLLTEKWTNLNLRIYKWASHQPKKKQRYFLLEWNKKYSSFLLLLLLNVPIKAAHKIFGKKKWDDINKMLVYTPALNSQNLR